MIHLLILMAAEYLMLWYATREERLLHSVAVVNMILLTLFAGKMMIVFGYQTNIANVFYAAVCASQLLSSEREGRAAALFTVRRVFLVMCAAVGLTVILVSCPVVAGNEAQAEAIRAIGQFSLQIVAASFLAFLAGQLVLLKVFERLAALPLFARYVAASITCQFVDSVIFFPVAFAGTDADVTEVAIAGCLLKIAVMLLFFPLLLLKPKTIDAA